ncbi:MAG: ABC transporter ATP-binding protein [Oscillospiraceae bacterium]|nr:ABC transporter ATP-binding protein [Oscillospiraceae bacterium]
MPILEAKDVSYSYRNKYQTIEAVKHVSCAFETGQFYAIVGHSGSGKTTFLSLLAGLDLPGEGEIYVDGRAMSSLNRDHYRRDMTSVVYQSFNLFPLLTALENVMYPMELQGKSKREAAGTAKKLIAEVGLGEKIWRQRPLMMSGGEQQRVSIARALAVGGKIMLADEPTGNLDAKNGEIVAGLLKTLAHEREYAVIVITHNEELARQADVVYTMHDGELTDGGGEEESQRGLPPQPTT